MGSPYIGELRLFGGNFAPYGWALCNGQLISISQNSPLYQLIGTTYGGDGVNTFGLPNLQGRFPIHQGQGTGLQNYVLGQIAGSETITLTGQQLPAHNHGAMGSNGSATPPANARSVCGATLGPARVRRAESDWAGGDLRCGSWIADRGLVAKRARR